MKTVNALKIRNRLGEVLDNLTKTGEPVLVSKDRKIRAVLITPEDFQRRFLDVQTEEKKKEFLQHVKNLRAKSTHNEESLELLRNLRGYDR